MCAGKRPEQTTEKIIATIKPLAAPARLARIRFQAPRVCTTQAQTAAQTKKYNTAIKVFLPLKIDSIEALATSLLAVDGKIAK
ncbi:hypothetical protein EMIT0P265_50385 [Pseudomonas zeae]